jgi:hypothetical protein
MRKAGGDLHGAPFKIEEARELTEQLPIESAMMVFWLQAYRYKSDNPPLALQYLQKMLNHSAVNKPTDTNILQLAADLAMADEQHPLTIDYITQLINLCEDDPSELHWDLMVPATIVERWDIVRASCQFLDIDLGLAQKLIDIMDSQSPLGQGVRRANSKLFNR